MELMSLIRLRCCLAAVALTCLAPTRSAAAEVRCADAPAAAAEKPVVFLDKSPVIVKYQLGRLSNAQLILVDRETTHPRFIPVYEAIAARPGVPAKAREEAVGALAVLNKSNVPAEILAGLQRLDATTDGSVIADLSRLLVSQPAETLNQSRSAIEELAGGDGPAAARPAAFGALINLQSAEELWKFAESKPGSLVHLIAAIPLAPDAARRAAFFPRIEPLLKAGGDAGARRAAIAAAAKMPGREAPAFSSLAKLVASGTEVPVVARALLALPRDQWPPELLKPLADALLEQARKFPEAKRTENDFLDVTQLGGELASRLPKDAGLALRKAFSSLGVNVVRLGTLPEQMFYDKTLVVVEAGKPVELVFRNSDVMPHNWVLTQPGALDEIGRTAEKMQPVADRAGRHYVPNSPLVLQATRMLNPNDTERLRFTAPGEPGDYPFVCTFPGHWQRMKGVLKVVKDLDEYLAQAPAQPTEPVITEWKLADLEPDLTKLAKGRDFAKGKDLFTNMGCAACHKLGGDGVAYGPELTGVFAKYQGDARRVLSEILEPSQIIEPRYRPYAFKPADGESFTGFLVKEEGDVLLIQTGPSEALIQKFAKKAISSREPQAQSIMPAGLLSLLNKEQVLDLLAFLNSGGDARHAAFKP